MFETAELSKKIWEALSKSYRINDALHNKTPAKHQDISRPVKTN